MNRCGSIAVIVCAGMLLGCAGLKLPPPSAKIVSVESALTHGADSASPLNDARYALATVCLSGVPPKFWARYFNHSDLPERENRAGYSFVPATEILEFKEKGVRILPIFAQNRNDVGELEGRVHGIVNASDFIRTVGALRIVRHMESKPLLVVLNEETPGSRLLTESYYKGWVEGFAATFEAIKANSLNIRPVVYGNVNMEPGLLEILGKLHVNRVAVPYAGFWRARPDQSLQTKQNAENCGRLGDWARGMEGWDENLLGPLLMRQYVLQAHGFGGVSVDLNALNPVYADELVEHMLLLND